MCFRGASGPIESIPFPPSFLATSLSFSFQIFLDILQYVRVHSERIHPLTISLFYTQLTRWNLAGASTRTSVKTFLQSYSHPCYLSHPDGAQSNLIPPPPPVSIAPPR